MTEVRGGGWNVQHFDHIVASVEDSRDVITAAAIGLVRKLRPAWPEKDMRVRSFNQGISNLLLGVYVQDAPDEVVMVRFYGKNTELFIDRKKELSVIKSFYLDGCGPNVYATFPNGMAYEFFPGRVVDHSDATDSNISQLIIEMMARMHKMTLPGVERKNDLWRTIRNFIDLSPDSFPHDSEYGIMSKPDLYREAIQLENALGSITSPVVLCHTDLLFNNIVYQETKRKIYFLDFEYATYMNQAFDIANHFCEFVGLSDELKLDYEQFYPKREVQESWIRRYLIAFKETRDVSEQEVHEQYVIVNKFALASHLLWATWALVQAKNSTIDFDFLSYAGLRLKEYQKKKEIFLSMI